MPTIWLLNLDEDPGAEPSWLSRQEDARALEFVRPLDAQRYRAAHQALRTILGSLTRQSPQALDLTHLPQGKPTLVGNDVPSFNLSHSQGWGALACCMPPSAPSVGVDLECHAQATGLESAADHFMSAQEWQQWLRLPREARALAALCCWTRKEAVLKALGCGLQAELTSFTVGLNPLFAQLNNWPHPSSPALCVWSWSRPMGLPVMLSVALVSHAPAPHAPPAWALRQFRAASRSGGPV